ncbi:MAG: hypothetical protein JST22_03410 [Bacteroidetes bacterium]|nr:hypothetical protein [Bacteroidota bacterium]
MNRRGFFSSVFHSRADRDPFFFGVQCVINIAGEDALRTNLHRVIATGGESELPADKHSLYKRVTALLRESVPFMEYGYWDYLTDGDEATDEFNNWVGEIEATMATEEEEVGDAADEAFRLSADKNYVVVTMAFLLEAENLQEEVCNIVEAIEEKDYFTPYGFQRLIEAVNYIDFEYSLGDAVFIMPGNETDGFSWTDMRGEGWEYLKPIMGTIN